MSRIRLLPPDEWTPSLRELVQPEGRTDLELGNVRIYAHRPELAEAYVRFTAGIRSNSTLPARLVELVRLRVAFHNQCRSCMAIRYADAVDAGVTEDLVCSLEKPEEAPDLTDAERAALRFADLLASDHLSISDQTIEDLRAHYDEPAIVELGMHIALYVGYGRLSMAWDMVDELPDRFHERDGRIAPWGGDDATVVGARR
ncbi:carboxymuconolactone decarboxylase family protein [Euzebya sp.]|uniref:carboxymuconolactone decarboxylase family protein n=1 Tax=Euzebya sp. TaxID=1971409 RepID=UPI003512166F